MSAWNEIKDSPAGTEFTDKDGDLWRFTETEVESPNMSFVSQNRKSGDADTFFAFYEPLSLVTKPAGSTPDNKYLTAALMALGIENITASTVRHIIETAQKIEEATK